MQFVAKGEASGGITMKMAALPFIFKLAPLLSTLVCFCSSQAQVRHPHLHLHLHPHLHRAIFGTGLEQSLELKYALRIGSPLTGYTAEGVTSLTSGALGTAESVTLDTWNSLVKNLLLGKAGQGVNQSRAQPSIALRNNNPIPSISINEKINSKQVNIGKSNAEYTDLHIGEAVVEEVGLELLKHLRTSAPRARTTTRPFALRYPNLHIGESVVQQVGRELLRHLKITTPKPQPAATTNQNTQMGFWKTFAQLIKQGNTKSTTEVTPSTTKAKTDSTEKVTPTTKRKSTSVSSYSTSSQFITQKLTKPTEGTALTKSLPEISSKVTSPETKIPKESTIPLTTQKTTQQSKTTERQTTVTERNLPSTAKVTTEMPKQTVGTTLPASTAIDKNKSITQHIEKPKEVSTEGTTKTVATQTERVSVTPKLLTIQNTQAQQTTNVRGQNTTVAPQTSLLASTPIKEQTKYSTVVSQQRNASAAASNAITGTTVIIPTVQMNLTKVPNITIQTQTGTTVFKPTSTTIVSGATKRFGSTGINITLREYPGLSTATLLQNSSAKYASTLTLSSPSWKSTENYNTTKSGISLYASMTSKGQLNGTTGPVTNVMTSKFPSSVTNLPTKNNTEKISTAGSVLTTKSQFSSQATAMRNTTGMLQSQAMGSTTRAGNSAAFSTSKPFSSTAAISPASGSPLKNTTQGASTQGNVQNKSSMMVTYSNLTSAKILAVTTAIPLMLGSTTSKLTTSQTKKAK